MSKRQQQLSAMHPVVVAGIVISLLLSLIPVFASQNLSFSLLIALVGIAASFLLDFALKLKDSEERLSGTVTKLQNDLAELVKKEGDEIREVVELGEELARDEALRSIIKDIVKDCETVKQFNIDVFTRRVEKVLNDCRTNINALADREEEIHGDFSFVPERVSTTPSKLNMVISSDPSYLLDAYGRKMLTMMKEAMKRNRHITVVWVQEKKILTDPRYRKVINEQELAGVEILVAEKGHVPPRLCKDYGVIDERTYFTPIFVDGIPDGEDISARAEKVTVAVYDFKQLYEHFAESANEYYENLDEKNRQATH